MNKFLLSTTALVAASVFAAPALSAERIQLQLRGYNTSGISYTDADQDSGYSESEDGVVYNSGTFPSEDSGTNEINFGSSSEIHFIGSSTLDNGLEVSFHAELELESDDQAYNGYPADEIDEVYVQFDGGFGRVQFGQQDGVMDQMAVTAPLTFMGHAHNDLEDRSMDPFAPQGQPNTINTVGDISGDFIKLIYFTPSMNGLQLGFSYTPNPCKNNQGYAGCVYEQYARNYWEVSGTWEASYNNVAFAFSGGYGQGEGAYHYDDPSEWTVGANVGFGGFTLGGSYKESNATGEWYGVNPGLGPWSGEDSDSEITAWDVGITYETGPWGFNLAYGQQESDSYTNDPYYTSDDSVLFESDAESWIAGLTYKYGPGMQIGFGVQYLSNEFDVTGVDGPFVDRYFTDFDGTSVFIENTITF
jgi:predicted porin